MSFFKNIFNTRDEQINSYNDFWIWFQKNERIFHKVIKDKGNIEREFFRKLSSKLNNLKDGFFYLTGMYDTNTVELVITADGEIKNIVFVEELVHSAPIIEGWRFTALKPSLNIKDVEIRMDDCIFNRNNLSFYTNDHKDFPDEIDLTVIHEDFTEANKQIITNGTYIFLDNYLGELNFATTIDNISIIGKDGSQKELIPIEKLKDFLTWREKEFIERYEGLRRNTEHDTYSILETELEDGENLIAMINTELLKWDSKASHPWVITIEIKFSAPNGKGMPNDDTYKFLNEIENEITKELKDYDGYLNVGRQTVKGVREIYFACRDFRKPSKVLHTVEQKYSKIVGFTYTIYKDKYWQTFNRFNVNP